MSRRNKFLVTSVVVCHEEKMPTFSTVLSDMPYTAVGTDDIERTKNEGKRAQREDYSTDTENSATEEFYADEDTNQDKRSGKASDYKTSVNILTLILSSGFLALPHAFAKGGVIVFFSFLIVPLIDCYTGKILIECLYVKDRLSGHKVRVHSTYRDLGVASAACAGGVIVDAAVYCSLASDMFNILVLGGSVMSYSSAIVPLSKRVCVLIMSGAVFPTIFFKNLANIAWLSMLNCVAVTATVLATAWYSLNHISTWKGSQILFFSSTHETLYALAIVVFCFESHTVLMDVEESMAHKKHFTRALCAAYSSTSLLAACFAVFSFLTFGKLTHGIIIDNLPEDPFRLVVSIFLIVAILFSFSVPFHATVHSIEHSLIAEKLRPKIPPIAWFLSLRCLIFLLMVLISFYLPFFATLSAFSGSLSVPLTTIVLPCVFHLRLKHTELRLIQIIANVSLAILGISLQGVSLFFSAQTLFEKALGLTW